jgi:hypothetical protein
MTENKDSAVSYYLEYGNFTGIEDEYYKAYEESIKTTYPNIVLEEKEMCGRNVIYGETIDTNNNNIKLIVFVDEHNIIVIECASKKEITFLEEALSGIITY